MASILEILRKSRQPVVAPANQTGTSETAAVQRLAAAKTGKAQAPGTTPSLSNMGEQAANAAAQAQQAQVNSQANLQTEEAVQAGLGAESQAQQAQTAIAANVSRGTERQQMGETKSLAFQQVFKESLASEQTKQRIAQKGEQGRWEDQNQFEQSLQRDIFGEDRYDLLRRLGFKNDLNQDQRDFESAFDNMKNEDIYNFAIQEFKQAAKRGQVQAAGTMASGAAQFAGRADKSPTSAASPSHEEATYDDAQIMRD